MDAPEPGDTLPFRGRILVRRLESFGDIVVGFSMSELALQLGIPKTPEDLVGDPSRYLFFFGTFAFIAVLWLRYHRMLTMGFAPGRLDLAFAFGFLAFTALLPYALFSMNRVGGQPSGVRYGLAGYVITLLGTSGCGLGITMRALKRRDPSLDASDIVRLRQRLVIEGGAIAVCFGSLAIDFTIGPQWAGPPFFLIALIAQIAKRFYRGPNWDAVHVHGVFAPSD